MENDIQQLIISEDMRIIDAMSHIDHARKGIAFLCNAENQLLAVLSDGDIRRYIIRNGDLMKPVSLVANYHFEFLPLEQKKQAKKVLREKHLRCLPIIDENRMLVAVYFWDYTEAVAQRQPLNLPVVIQAGGKGTRLYPYTKILPKALIPIGDMTITERIIQHFLQYQCNDFYLIINHKKNMLKAYFSDIVHDYHISFVEEDKPLGTGGGLKMLENAIQTSFFLSNCDILIDSDYQQIYKEHKRQGSIATIICAAKQTVIPYGTILLNEEGMVTGLQEKPSFSFIANTGMYLFEPEIFDYIPDHTFIHIPDVLQTCMKAEKKVGIFPVSENQWSDMGQINELKNMYHKFDL